MYCEKSKLVKAENSKSRSRSRTEDETRPFSVVHFQSILDIGSVQALSCSGKTQVDGSRSGRKGLRNPPCIKRASCITMHEK